jgi:hypothetical protein
MSGPYNYKTGRTVTKHNATEQMAKAIYEAVPTRASETFAELPDTAKTIWRRIARTRLGYGETAPPRQEKTS